MLSSVPQRRKDALAQQLTIQDLCDDQVGTTATKVLRDAELVRAERDDAHPAAQPVRLYQRTRDICNRLVHLAAHHDSARPGGEHAKEAKASAYVENKRAPPVTGGEVLDGPFD